MATKQTVPFDELTRLASDFVTQQQGMWDHSVWPDFLARLQGRGIDLTAIAGLGPAMAKKLRQEGIVSYAALAALSTGRSPGSRRTSSSHPDSSSVTIGWGRRGDWLGRDRDARRSREGFLSGQALRRSTTGSGGTK
jgi:hypothetical protein